MAVTRQQLMACLDELLQPHQLNDYCPNGLQVEGTDTIKHLVTGVTASQALIDRAISENADALLVHHGYFWKGENPALVGIKAQRIRQLLGNNINLIAYHLPIDVHPKQGNNVQLGELLGFKNLAPLPSLKPNGIVYSADTAKPVRAGELHAHIATQLGRAVLHEGDKNAIVKTVAWCTGGGQGYIEQAAQAGVDAFITGEVSEQTIHIAREMNIHFYAAGHHATERYGVKAVGEWVGSKLPVTVQFIDIDNPA
ncbi:Nif3-like dinuclear metal center hexameric protein [Alteromonas sp. C1M14]|uniref:Nif3-like dinuclear metal center hexameric protein n=1 Tax=Alteromonas sp. C1M14 TaxID=2841567 RepID=UPI001C083457|nr:Nif3-like dinuclear metal center hexameric protein [Alteromonas sp. C1M14]MBU2976953.1 Nif3-like dinuclear metal center hexameric protein [Alteromonas sp. C1M14]